MTEMIAENEPSIWNDDENRRAFEAALANNSWRAIHAGLGGTTGVIDALARDGLLSESLRKAITRDLRVAMHIMKCADQSTRKSAERQSKAVIGAVIESLENPDAREAV